MILFSDILTPLTGMGIDFDIVTGKALQGSGSVGQKKTMLVCRQGCGFLLFLSSWVRFTVKAGVFQCIADPRR